MESKHKAYLGFTFLVIGLFVLAVLGSSYTGAFSFSRRSSSASSQLPEDRAISNRATTIPKLYCNQYFNSGLANPNNYCKQKGYDACVGGEMTALVPLPPDVSVYKSDTGFKFIIISSDSNGEHDYGSIRNIKMRYTLPIKCTGYEDFSDIVNINNHTALVDYFVRENIGLGDNSKYMRYYDRDRSGYPIDPLSFDVAISDASSTITCCRVR